jgi:hypothetical protein
MNAADRIKNNIEIDPITGCWNWLGRINAGGYGTFGMKLAHRLSYLNFIGEISDGMDICHKCDNRKCINPDHLFQGTRKENMEDAVKKNRQAKGSMLPQTKLNASNVVTIRALYIIGIGYRKLSKQFNVSQSAIKKVVTNQTWRNV